MKYDTQEKVHELAKRVLDTPHLHAWELREIEKLTFPQMEEKTGIKRTTIYLQWKKAASILNLWINDPDRFTTSTLSAHSYHALSDQKIHDKKEALKAYQSGRLFPNAFRGYGSVCHDEVCEWLGVAKAGPSTEKEVFRRLIARLDAMIDISPEIEKTHIMEEVATVRKIANYRIKQHKW